jgi:hypothetical protein
MGVSVDSICLFRVTMKTKCFQSREEMVDIIGSHVFLAVVCSRYLVVSSLSNGRNGRNFEALETRTKIGSFCKHIDSYGC